MRAGCARRRAGAILGRMIKAFHRPAVARQAAAEKAAQGLRLALVPAVAAKVRWAFTPPRSWLSGVAANLIVALVWMLVQPLHLPRHHDWVILIGTHFSSFILADVTTTNLLGAEHIRVRKALRDGAPLWRVLLVKNLALVVIVGLPTIAFGDGHDVVARNTRSAGSDDSQRRRADCLLARGRKPGVRAVSRRRRATDPSLGTAPRPQLHDQVDWPLGVAIRPVLRRRPHRRHRAQLLLE